MAEQHNIDIIINALGSEKVKSELGRIKQAFNNLSKSIDNLKKRWVEILGATYTLKKAFDFTQETAKFYQSFQAFKSMVESFGKNATVEFEKLKKASAGLIDNESLIEAANRAMSLGIPIEKLADLMVIARAKSRDMGITLTQAFNDIVTGIGRASPMIIDNLGIVLKIGEANKAYAESIGKTVDELTAQERKMAILQAVLKSGSEALSRYDLQTKTLNERFQQFRATLEDLKLILGEVFIRVGAGFMGVFQGAAGVVLKLSSGVFSLIKGLSWLTDKLGITKGAFQEWKLSAEAAAAAGKDLLEQAKSNFELMTISKEKLMSSLGGTTSHGMNIDNTSIGSDEKEQSIKTPGTAIAYGLKLYQQQIFEIYQARKWLSDRLNKLTLSEFDYRKAKLLEEYEERAKVLGWTKELYRAFMMDLRKIQDEEAEREKSEQQKKTEKIRQMFDDWYERNKESLYQSAKEIKGPWGNFKEGIQETLKNFGDAFDQMKQLGIETAQALYQSFSDFFFNMITGRLKRLKDVIKSFLEGVARALSNLLSQNAVIAIFKALNIEIPKKHEGGLVMHQGGYVPRFHFGGLASDEVPAILQRGEYVVSRRGVEVLDRLNKGQLQPVNVKVEIKNETGVPVEAEQGSIEFDGEKYIIGVILKNIYQNGEIRRIITQGI